MAPTHRMETYHDFPPPIPVKLKPRALKKLSHSKGPVYLLVSAPPGPNFGVPIQSFGTISENGNPSSVLDCHQRFRPEKNSRPKVQNHQWKRHNRNTNNWIKHLTNSDDEESIYRQRTSLTEVQLSSRVASMTIADVSPRFALKKILLLYENAQYRESANFINRLSGNTFGVIVHDLPIDLFIDSMPQSLPIVESLYAKVFLSDGFLPQNWLQFLRPESVVMQIVKFFASQDNSLASISPGTAWRLDYCGPFISSCKKLLRVICLSDPKIRKNLQQKRKALDKAIEGLGQHGLVGTSDENLLNLHDALKLEFHQVVQSYKVALSKLEELDLAHKKTAVRTVSNGPAPIQASHQRQLSLKQNDIQERLIKNKTLLNVVEPTLTNHSLDLFLGILQRRIELDKDVLFQFTQLKKESKTVETNAVVAPLLMKFSYGCQQVLELMREVTSEDHNEEDDSSDVSGYHSDCESAVMASGNSPFVSKSIRYNFLTRSVRLGSQASVRTSILVNSLGLESTRVPHKVGPCSSNNTSSRSTSEESDTRSATSDSSEASPLRTKTTPNIAASKSTPIPSCQRCQITPPTVSNPTIMNAQNENDLLKAEVKKANTLIASLQEKEKKLKERLAHQAQLIAERAIGGKFETPECAEQRMSLIRSYGNLYAQSRVETLEWLDKMEQLRNADELKSKLLFSVIVLSFRSVQASSSQIKESIRRILQIPFNPIQVTYHSKVPPPPPPPPCVTFNHRPPPPPPPPNSRKESRRNAGNEVEHAVTSYLKQSVDFFDLTKNTEDVCSQIWATLYDYPCLQSCEGLIKYIKDSVRLSWSLVNQSPPFHLEYESRTFKSDFHIRFHSSNPNEDSIKTYLWPALVEGHNGPCVHKAIVIT